MRRTALQGQEEGGPGARQWPWWLPAWRGALPETPFSHHWVPKGQANRRTVAVYAAGWERCGVSGNGEDTRQGRWSPPGGGPREPETRTWPASRLFCAQRCDPTSAGPARLRRSVVGAAVGEAAGARSEVVGLTAPRLTLIPGPEPRPPVAVLRGRPPSPSLSLPILNTGTRRGRCVPARPPLPTLLPQTPGSCRCRRGRKRPFPECRLSRVRSSPGNGARQAGWSGFE